MREKIAEPARKMKRAAHLAALSYRFTMAMHRYVAFGKRGGFWADYAEQERKKAWALWGQLEKEIKNTLAGAPPLL